MTWKYICNGVRRRYIDPLLRIVVGPLVCIVSPPLGGWLMFSGVALAVYEQAIHEKDIERDRHTGQARA